MIVLIIWYGSVKNGVDKIQEINHKIIAFKTDGTLVVFDNRKDYDDNIYNIKKLSCIFASPKFCYERLNEYENTITKMEKALWNKCQMTHDELEVFG